MTPRTVLTREQRRSFLSFLASLVGRASRDPKLRRLMLGQGWPALLELLEASFLAGVHYITPDDILHGDNVLTPENAEKFYSKRLPPHAFKSLAHMRSEPISPTDIKPRQKVPRKPSMFRKKSLIRGKKSLDR